MTYYVSYKANNGSTYINEAIAFTNKKEARTYIRAIASGEHYQVTGNKTTYKITNEDGGIIEICVLRGRSPRWLKW